MCSGLAAAIDEFEVALDSAALREALVLSDRLRAKVVAAIGAFDRAELWDLDDATSMTAWLRQHGALTGKAAATTARVGRLVDGVAEVGSAWRSGSLSGAQVEVIATVVTDRRRRVFVDQAAHVVPRLARLTVRDTQLAMQHWAQRADHELGEGEDPEPSRALHVSETLDGRRELSGHLDAGSAVFVEAALRLAQTDDVDGEPERAPAERRADALVDVCRFFLDHQQVIPGGRHRPHVNLLTTTDDLPSGANARSVDGTVLPASLVRSICCDAAFHRVVTDGRSGILDVGRSSRSVNASQWTALVVRDRHCRFPGCDRPVHWCEAHHVVPWETGGPTCLPNLVLLCSRHHHRVHRAGWRVALDPVDATLELTTPDGHALSSRPPPTGRSPDLFAA